MYFIASLPLIAAQVLSKDLSNFLFLSKTVTEGSLFRNYWIMVPIQISGLEVGKTITVPGDDSTQAMKNGEQGLF